DGCAAGEVAKDGGGCRPAGIPPEACAEGFMSDPLAGCIAVLPPAACPQGQMAVPGETGCRELTACGTTPWGDAPLDDKTQYVDAAYGSSDSNGTVTKPWKTVQQGVDAAAQQGATIAIAAGTYTEDVHIEGKAVRLWGRCPKMVEIAGTGA